MRRVALAGVLALRPEVLVLDEPTAGLDPQGRRALLEQILTLHREHGVTLVLVSHDMEELAAICHRICVIDGGTVVQVDTPHVVFGQAESLRRRGLGVPAVTDALERLRRAGVIEPGETVLTVDRAAAILAEVLHEQRI
jgi:energy-coupling factor transport system ATP-binding protein